MRKISFLILIAFLTQCQNLEHENGNNKHKGHHNKEPHVGHHKENHVKLDSAQVSYAGIKTGNFLQADLHKTVKATGRLQLPPDNEAHVSPLIGGLVKSIRVIVGDYVKKGEVLAVLQNTEYVNMQQEYLESINALSYKEKEYNRQKSLYEDSVGSAKSFQKIASDYKALKSKIKGLEKRLSMIGININKLNENNIREKIVLRAPIGGYIREIHTSMGSFEDRHSRMFEIVDNHHIHIDLMVYEQDLLKIRKGQEVLFNFANNPRPEPLRARIFATGKAMQKKQRAVRMHAEVLEKNIELVPGMYVEALIVNDTVKTKKALPEDAVIREKDSHYIFIKKPGHEQNKGVFEKIKVNAGVSHNNLRQVSLLEKLPENKGIVIKGAHYLQREALKGMSGHNH